MPDFVVSTAFKAQDLVTKSFKRMSGGADKFGDSASAAFRKASNSGVKFQSITAGILKASAIQEGLSLIKMGLTEAAGGFVAFDDAATGAAVRFKDIGPDATNFKTQLELIKKTARDAGATTEFTAAQAASGLDFLARAGFSSAEAIGSLNSMIGLATATGEDFATVADYSSDLLGSFGLAAKDTTQKIANLNRLNDVLVKTANSANVTVEDMFETMKVGAPVAVKFGASLEDVAAMTAIMGNAGIKGSEGATALKNIFTRLSAPTKEVTDGLAALGLTQQDMIDKQGNLKNIVDIMEMIGTRLGGVAQPKQLGILKGLFGSFALAGGANLIDAIKDVGTFRDMLEKAGGTSGKTADILRQSLGNQLKALGSAATEFAFRFFEAMEGTVRKVITATINALRDFNVKPWINGAKLIAKSFGGLIKEAGYLFKVMLGLRGETAKPLFSPENIERAAFAIEAVLNAIKPLIPILPVVIGGMLAYSAALKVQAFFQAVTAIKAMSGSMGILNAVMSANPIGAIIMGITALIAAGILLYKNWDQVSAGLVMAWDWMSQKASMAFTWIADTASTAMTEVAAIVQRATDFMGGVFTEIGKLLFQTFIDPLIYGFVMAAKAALKLGSTVGKLIGINTDGLQQMVDNLEGVRQEILKSQAEIPTQHQPALSPVGMEFITPNMPKSQQQAISTGTMELIVPKMTNASVPPPPIIKQEIQQPAQPSFTPRTMEQIIPHMPAQSEQTRERKAVAPNQTDVQLRQQVNVGGNIKVSGIPEESTADVRATNGGGQINMEMLGVNP